MIRRVQVTVPTTGSNGSAIGSAATQPIVGEILAVHLDYTSEPNTTDVTVATVAAPTQTILTVANSNADGWKYPRVAVHDTAGAAATYDGTNEIYEPQAVADQVIVSVAQGDNAGTVVATIIYEE